MKHPIILGFALLVPVGASLGCDGVTLDAEPAVVIAPASTATVVLEVASQVPDASRLDFKPSAVTGAGGFNSYVAYDDVKPGRVLAGGDVSGIWTSTDHGLTWWPTMEGIEDPEHRHIASIAVFGGDSYFAGGRSFEVAQKVGTCSETQPPSAIYRMARGTTTWQRLTGAPVQFSGTEDDCIAGNSLGGPNVTGRLFAYKATHRAVFAGTYRLGVVAAVPTCTFNGVDDDGDGLVDEVDDNNADGVIDEDVCGDSPRMKLIPLVWEGTNPLAGKRITSVIAEDDQDPASSRLLVSYRAEPGVAGGVLRFGVVKRSFNQRPGSPPRPPELRAFNAEQIDLGVSTWLQANAVALSMTEYSPEEIAMYRGEVYIAASNVGVYRCSLRGRGTCVGIIGPAPFFKDGKRLGPYWSTVGTRRNASSEDEIWFGARAWPTLNDSDPASIRYYLAVDGSRPPKRYTTLIRLRNGLLRDMAEPVALSLKVGSASGLAWWWTEQRIDGVPASTCEATPAVGATPEEVDRAQRCAVAKGAFVKMRDRLENIDYIAFNPFIATRMMVTPLRRSDDRGTNWYFSNRQANGVVGHRVRYDAGSGRTFASMHDHMHVESTSNLETVTEEVAALRWNRFRHGTGNARGFAFGHGFVFIAAQPQPANSEPFPEIWAQRPGADAYSRPLRRTQSPQAIGPAARWESELFDLTVGCGGVAASCDAGIGWRLMTVLRQIPAEASEGSTPFAVVKYANNPTAMKTLTIGTKTYVFVVTPGDAPEGQVPVTIGASADASWANLVTAIAASTATTGVAAEIDEGDDRIYLTLLSGKPKDLVAFGTTLDSASARVCGALKVKNGVANWVDCEQTFLASCDLAFQGDSVECVANASGSVWSTLALDTTTPMLGTVDDRLSFFWPAGNPRPYLWNRWTGLWAESPTPGQAWQQVVSAKVGGTGTGHARLSKKVAHRLYYTDQTGILVVDAIDTATPTTTCLPIPGKSVCRPPNTETTDKMATALAVADDDVLYVAVRDDLGGPPKLWRLHYGAMPAAPGTGTPPQWQDVTDPVYRSVSLNVEDMDMGPNGKLFVTPTGSGFLIGTPR